MQIPYEWNNSPLKMCTTYKMDNFHLIINRQVYLKLMLELVMYVGLTKIQVKSENVNQSQERKGKSTRRGL